jgi:hypothetical protein
MFRASQTLSSNIGHTNFGHAKFSAMPSKPKKAARGNPYLRTQGSLLSYDLSGSSRPVIAELPCRPQSVHMHPPSPNHQQGSVAGSSSDAPPGERRADAPCIRSYGQGNQLDALSIASNTELLSKAQLDLSNRKYSNTTLRPREARLALWDQLLRASGVRDPFALTPDIIMSGAAILQAAGYRSTMAYVDIAAQEFVRRGGTKSQLLELTIRDARRACARGQGAPKHSGAFPMERLIELQESKTPFVPNGPLWPRRTLTCGMWWLTREIELSNAVVGDVSRPEPDSVRWNLPASKSDPKALGMSRTHKCGCGGLANSVAVVDVNMCPACNLWSQMLDARAFSAHVQKHHEYFDEGSELSRGEHFPLFPTAKGRFPTKFCMIGTIVSAATKLDLEINLGNKPVFGGHSLRRGGAQYLARSGVDVWRIQALARHSSSAILLYLDGVHADSLGNIASEASLGRSLFNVREELGALRAQLERHKADLIPSLNEALPVASSKIIIPICASEIVDLSQPRSSGPSPLEVTSVVSHPFVLSSRAGGRSHRRDPSAPDKAMCGWRWSNHPGALLVSSDDKGLGCTKCAKKSTAVEAIASDSDSPTSAPPSPEPASGGE